MQDLYPRPHSPFDSGAIDRPRRMGLLIVDGQADLDAMLIFSHIFAGQLYDDLRDYCQDDEDARELLSQLFADGFLAHLRQLEKITSEGGPL